MNFDHEIEKNDFDQFMMIMQGHVAFQCLKAGIEFKLFDLLAESGSLSRKEIMHKLGLQETPCKILLRALYSLNLINKENEKFKNAPIASQYLVGELGDQTRDILGWQDKIVYPAIVDFIEALKTGTNVGIKHFPGHGSSLYERLSSDKQLEAIFQKAMSGLSRKAHGAFYEKLDLQGKKTIMDVGGGDGSNLKALLEKYPDKTGIIFDLPSVCQLAEKNIANWGLSDRLKTFSGNLFQDDFPKNVDVILFCHIFTIWSDDKIVGILKKCHQSLAKGGQVVVFNMLSNDNEYGPISCALGSPYFLTIATGEGKLHTVTEIKSWFNQIGFSNVEYQGGLPIDHGIIIATK